MLLYIHVPFCQQKCAYCAFYSLPLDTAARDFLPHTLPQGATGPCFSGESSSCGTSQTTNLLLEKYCQTLETEIALRAPHTPHHTNTFTENSANNTTPLQVTSIFFGGGTPSLLSSRQVEKILSAIQKHFSLASKIEITMEANPESASRPHWLHDIRAAGVNRLSLGVQSFHQTELTLLGRKHSLADVERTVNLAHQARFLSLSLDLMWGIPHAANSPSSSTQATPSPSFTRRWLTSLTSALELSPHHISAYGLILEEGTPLAQQAEKANSSLLFPQEKEEQAMYKEGIELLQRHGFIQYEISNYALEGHQCQHNLGYWQGADYYGFGPAAVSTLNTTRFANTSNLSLWLKGIEQSIPAGEEEALTPLMLQEEKVMLSLRMTKGLASEDWDAISPIPLQALPLVQQLLADNLATLKEGHLALTPAGMMVSNTIISRLFEAIP